MGSRSLPAGRVLRTPPPHSRPLPPTFWGTEGCPPRAVPLREGRRFEATPHQGWQRQARSAGSPGVAPRPLRHVVVAVPVLPLVVEAPARRPVVLRVTT